MMEFKEVDYDVLSKSILKTNQMRVPKKHKYCVKSATEPKKTMYVYAYSVSVSQNGSLIFLNEFGEIIVGVSPSKFSSFFMIDENNVPIDVSRDIL